MGSMHQIEAHDVATTKQRKQSHMPDLWDLMWDIRYRDLPTYSIFSRVCGVCLRVPVSLFEINTEKYRIAFVLLLIIGHILMLLVQIMLTYIDTWPTQDHISVKFAGTLSHKLAHMAYFIQYIPRNMHTVFALLCFVVVIHWLIFPYPSG